MSHSLDALDVTTTYIPAQTKSVAVARPAGVNRKEFAIESGTFMVI
jgi:hypothetical protein